MNQHQQKPDQKQITVELDRDEIELVADSLRFTSVCLAPENMSMSKSMSQLLDKMEKLLLCP